MKLLKATSAKLNHLHEAQRKGRALRLPKKEECKEVHCLNCGTSYQGLFCPMCGQQANIKRFSTRKMFVNLIVSVVGGDNAFFNTCLNLSYRPGYMMRDYLCGIRARYFQPVRMLVCLVAVFALVSFVFNNNYEPFSLLDDAAFESNVHSKSLEKAMQLISGFFSNNVVFALFSAFLYVLPFKWLYRKKKLMRPDGEEHSLNTAEHFYVMVYVSCQSMLISFLLLPFSGIANIDTIVLVISLVTSVVLPAWCYRQLFEISWAHSLLKSLMASFITYMTLTILIVLMFGFFYGIDAVSK